MKELTSVIESTLAKGDFIQHNQADIKLHDVFLNLSANTRLLRYVKILKMQLYDFPRKVYGQE